MKILLSGSRRRWLKAAAGVAVLAIAIGVIYNYGREYRSVRADRSNALQVVKPLGEVSQPVVSDFFAEARIDRERLRSEQAELLREAMRGTKNEEGRQKAQDAILRLTADKQREGEIEALVKARGFADVLIFRRDNAVSAVVRAPALSQEEVAQIADIISRIAGVKMEDIVISSKQ